VREEGDDLVEEPLERERGRVDPLQDFCFSQKAGGRRGSGGSGSAVVRGRAVLIMRKSSSTGRPRIPIVG
jgi:hypothetical protein